MSRLGLARQGPFWHTSTYVLAPKETDDDGEHSADPGACGLRGCPRVAARAPWFRRWYLSRRRGGWLGPVAHSRRTRARRPLASRWLVVGTDPGAGRRRARRGRAAHERRQGSRPRGPGGVRRVAHNGCPALR